MSINLRNFFTTDPKQYTVLQKICIHALIAILKEANTFSCFSQNSLDVTYAVFDLGASIGKNRIFVSVASKRNWLADAIFCRKLHVHFAMSYVQKRGHLSRCGSQWMPFVMSELQTAWTFLLRRCCTHLQGPVNVSVTAAGSFTSLTAVQWWLVQLIVKDVLSGRATENL